MCKRIGEILQSLEFIPNADEAKRGKAGLSEAKGNLGVSRRVPKEFSARKLGRGDPPSEDASR